MVRFIRRFFILAALIFVFTACTGNVDNGGGPAPQQPVASSTPIPTAPAVARPTYLVQRGDVQQILNFTGRWQPRDQTPLSFAIAGTVRRVNVRIGDTVTVGQLLADYQITSLEDQLASALLSLETAKANLTSGATGSVSSVADAQIALANAQLSLQRTKADSPWTQVASARVQLDSARQQLANAQRAYDDAVSDASNPPSTIDSAYNQLQSAKNSLRSAEISYDSAAQSFNNYQFSIKSAENQVIQAQLQLLKAQQGGTNPSGEQAVRSAQLNIDQIQQQIQQSSLTAPMDGEVLSVTIKPGDAVQAFATVITIGRPEPKEAIASLAIGDAQQLNVGMVGACQVLNKPDTAVQCVVRRIPLTARDADQTTRVAASLEDLKLPTNQIIDIEMPLKVSSNVLWLPPAAIRTFQSRTFVVVQTADGPRSIDVQLGLQTDERVEIKEVQGGVKEGDVVIGQ
jgi:multidrug efflux pump subunit AcrA (membrane-fusion protein)